MSFYQRPSGRPWKERSNALRPATLKTQASDVLAPSVPFTTAAETEHGDRCVKVRRTNYSKGEGLVKMTSATTAWEEEQQKPENERKSMKKFAKEWGIPFSTLQGRGLSNTMDNNLTVTKPRGRPKKMPSIDGGLVTLIVPAPDPRANPAAPSPTAAEREPDKSNVKARRMNYSSGDGLAKMMSATIAWSQEQQKPADERKSLKIFARDWGIPYSTLQGYLTVNDSKRIKLGSSVGKSPIIGSEEERAIVDFLIRKNQANEGLNVGEAVDVLKQLMPHCTREQLDNSFRRYLRPKYSHMLTNPATNFKTTTERTTNVTERSSRATSS